MAKGYPRINCEKKFTTRVALYRWWYCNQYLVAWGLKSFGCFQPFFLSGFTGLIVPAWQTSLAKLQTVGISESHTNFRTWYQFNPWEGIKLHMNFVSVTGINEAIDWEVSPYQTNPGGIRRCIRSSPVISGEPALVRYYCTMVRSTTSFGAMLV